MIKLQNEDDFSFSIELRVTGQNLRTLAIKVLGILATLATCAVRYITF